MQKLGLKPEGVLGCFAGRLMNLIHGRFYKAIIKNKLGDRLKRNSSAYVLDVGCGGGRTVAIFNSLVKDGKAYGIDHSKDMVELSERINAKAVKTRKVEICQGDAAALPYPTARFDFVTAFDTLNFWGNIEKSIGEIFRVMKPGGIFLVVNGYPKECTKWWSVVSLKSEKDYVALLEKHGFENTNTEIVKTTIIVSGEKPMSGLDSRSTHGPGTV